MTPIIQDVNAIKAELNRPENKELSDLIAKDLSYMIEQSRNLGQDNKKYLFWLTVQRMVKIVKEYPMMIDGRNNQSNNNNEPF